MRLGTKSDKSDPYVTAFLEDYRLLKTRVVDDDLNPVSAYSYDEHIFLTRTYILIDL